MDIGPEKLMFGSAPQKGFFQMGILPLYNSIQALAYLHLVAKMGKI